MKSKNTNTNNGITLIALIITIILMLILASVTINVAINGGLFEYAGNAKDSTEIASEKEAIQKAAIIAKDKSKTGRITEEEMQKALDKIINEGKATAIDNDETIVVKIEQSGRYYEVDNKGKVSEYILYEDKTPGELARDENGNYMIESIEDLVTFSAMVNGGYSDESISIVSKNWMNVLLMRDLNFKSTFSYNDSTTTIYNGYLGIEDENVTLMEALTNTNKYKGFIPIGKDETYRFNGTFDGQNHKIKNLYENIEGFGGLFGCVGGAKVKNITITGELKGTKNTGGIIGYLSDASGTYEVINCTNYANVECSASAGGIIGHAYVNNGGTITFCNNYGDIKSSVQAGGIIGHLNGYGGDNSKMNLGMNYNNAYIKGSYAGGIVGYIKSVENFKVYNCVNGKGSLVEGGCAAGIIGFLYSSPKIYNSINLGTIKSNYSGRNGGTRH